MTQIGQFTATSGGFNGRLQALQLDTEISITAIDRGDTENAPDYRIHLGADNTGPEIGAGWKRTGDKAGAYVAVQFEGPTLTQPIRANLFQSNDGQATYVLLWNRPSRREGPQ